MIRPRSGDFEPAVDGPVDELESGSSQAILVRMVGRGKSVLQVGCGGGHLTRRLSASDNRVTAIDADAGAVDAVRPYCEAALLADLDRGRLGELVRANRFDVAIFRGVIEELREPLRALREARALLAEDGFVVLSIRNAAHGSVRLPRPGFESSGKAGARGFTLRSACELALRAGYRVADVERTKEPLITLSDAVARLDERDLSSDASAEIRRDPEHDTARFVLRAVPISEAEQLEAAFGVAAEAESKHAAAERRIAVLEREIVETRDAVVTAQGARDALAQQLGQAQERALHREAAAFETAAERDRLSREFAATITAFNQAQSSAAELAEELRQENAALRTSRQTLRDEYEALCAEREALRSAGREAALAAEAAERSAAALQAELCDELAALRAEAASGERERETLASKVADAETRAAAFEAGVRQAVIERAQLVRELAQTREAARVAESAAEASHEELRRENSALRAACGDAEKGREELERRLAENDEAALGREISVAQTLSELRRSFAVQERELTKLAGERIESEARRHAVELSAVRASARNAEWSVAEALHELRLDHLSLAAMLAEAQTQRDAAAALVTQARARGADRLAAARTAEGLVAEALDELRVEYVALSAAHHDALEAHEAVAALLGEASVREDRLRASIARRTDAFASARLAESQVAGALEELRSRHALLSAELRETEAERDTLRVRLAEWRELSAAHEAAAVRSTERSTAAAASAREAEWRVAEALESSRIAFAALATMHYETASEREALARRLAEAEAVSGDAAAAMRHYWNSRAKPALSRLRRRLLAGRARA